MTLAPSSPIFQNDDPQPRKRGCLRSCLMLVLGVVLLGLLLSGVGLYLLFRPIAVPTTEALASYATGGLLLVDLDLNDEALTDLMVDLNPSMAVLREPWLKGLAAAGIHRELVFINRLGPNLEDEYAMVMRFPRLWRHIHTLHAQQVAAGHEPGQVMNGNVVVKQEANGESLATPGGVAFVDVVRLRDDMLDLLSNPAQAQPPAMDAQHRQLFDRLTQSTARARAYMINRDGRLAKDLRNDPELFANLSPAARNALINEVDANLQALVGEATLRDANSLDLKVVLICRSQEAARLVLTYVENELLPGIQASLPDLQVSRVVQQDREVVFQATLVNIRQHLQRQPQP